MMHLFRCSLAAVVLGVFCVGGCAESVPVPNPRAVASTAVSIEMLDAAHLPNAVRVHEKVISGGLPEGLAAFEELQKLGIKTVISVDGARPDVATAEQCGLRYVHLPHGYDGVPESRVAELAKAVRDLPGPIYIHCHHGKHRSPAAAAVACVASGLLPRSDALTVLQVAGTSPHYRGLYESANSVCPLDAALLDHLQAEFPKSAKLPAFAEAMVAVEQTHDRLKAFDQAGWRKVPRQPDLIPAHEALLLREHYTEMLRMDTVQKQSARFKELLTKGESHARSLEEALLAWSNSGTSAAVPEQITGAFKAISANCKMCHEEFRDVPLSEKGTVSK